MEEISNILKFDLIKLVPCNIIHKGNYLMKPGNYIYDDGFFEVSICLGSCFKIKNSEVNFKKDEYFFIKSGLDIDVLKSKKFNIENGHLISDDFNNIEDYFEQVSKKISELLINEKNKYFNDIIDDKTLTFEKLSIKHDNYMNIVKKINEEIIEPFCEKRF